MSAAKNVVAGTAATKAARKPSKAVVTKGAPSAAALAASPFAARAAPAAPVKAPEAATPAVALRGGPAVASVKLTGKVYRTKAAHNLAWWAAITSVASASDSQPATVAQLIEDKVPSHFIGYCLRRGYLASV